MARRGAYRAILISGAGLRHVVVPLGTLLVSWWVVRTGSMELWGGLVLPIITLNLFVHVAQWGSRDLLLRVTSSGNVDPSAWWKSSMVTRIPLALPLLLAPAFLPGLPFGWMLCWAIGQFTAAGLEALIIRQKRFHFGAVADIAGLAAQFILLTSAPLDAALVVQSFAVHQVIRALLLWITCGRPSLFPIAFDPRTHLRIAIPFALIGISGILATRVDVYSATALLSSADLGRYQILAGLYVQFQVIPGLVAKPFLPELMRMPKTELLRISTRAMGWGITLQLPLALAAWTLLTFGFGFIEVWPLLIAGAIASLPAFGYVPLFPLLYRIHAERQVMLISFAGAALTAICAVLLFPSFGSVGGLIAAACGQWAQLILVRRRVQVILSSNSLPDR